MAKFENISKKIDEKREETKVKEYSKVKQFFSDLPVKILSLIYNFGLYLMLSFIVIFIFTAFVGAATVLPTFILGLLGFSLTDASAVNTMAMLAITMFVAGSFLMLLNVITKTLYTKIVKRFKMTYERDEESGKLRIVKK